MSKIDRKKYVYAQLKSLPNAFQYVEVTQYIESLENQLKQQSNAIDECIEIIKYGLAENDGRVNARMETRYYNELLEKLQQVKENK